MARGKLTRPMPKRKYFGAHGLHSRLYTIWRAMHFRCYYPSHEAYPRYGGRGITVCPEWHEYIPFRDWALANGYADNLTIDREENDLGYTPDNCRWVTMAQQQRNRRDNHLVTAFGETKHVVDWSADPRCTISNTSLCKRLQAGEDPESAITRPGRIQKTCAPVAISAFGESKGVAEWLADPRCKTNQFSLRKRIENGWNPERAISEPTRRMIRRSPCFH